MEIERKFKVRELPDLSQYPFKQLEQGYLNTNPVVRVRKEDEEYYLTYKGKGFLEREEYNLPLNKEAYEHLITKADGRVITKKRYLIHFEYYTIELDIFEGDLAPLIIAEVEFETKEEAVSFTPPDWFGEDVTEDPSYSNSNLSKK
ncbi:MAG: CYTH domain-containing protein [Lachnospiraceae bacterium]|nr:CYTH domain-containing protein [Lachnospiraceae bacterium]